MRLWVLQESQNRKCVKGLPIPYHWKSAEEQTTKAKEKLDLKILWLLGMKLVSNSTWISDFSGSQSGKGWTMCGALPPPSVILSSILPPSSEEPRDQRAGMLSLLQRNTVQSLPPTGNLEKDNTFSPSQERNLQLRTCVLQKPQSPNLTEPPKK